MRRSSLILGIILLSAAFLRAGPVRAAALPQPAQDYIKLRAKTQAVVDLPLQQLRAQLEKLRGKVVEIAGTITGTMSRGGQSIEGKKLISFLLNDGRGGSVIVQCTEGIAEVQPRNRVRVLVRLDADAQTVDFSPLVAIVRETDLPKQWREGATQRQGASAQRQPGDADADRQPENVGPELVTTVRTPMTLTALEQRRAQLTLNSSDFEQNVGIYANLIPLWNPELTPGQCDLIARCILVYSPTYNLDHRLVFAMVACESSFNPLATSPKGAMGLGQLMPGTAAGLGVSDAYDIEQNLRGSIEYLAAQVHRYAGYSNYDMFCRGVAAYNAGPNRVAKAGGVPNIPETIRYVNRVAKLFKELYDKGYP